MIQTVGEYAGQQVREATLACGAHRVHILNYGCVVRRWLFDTGREQRDLVLGFDAFEQYPLHSRSFGIIAGRVANRTRGGRFRLHDKDWQLTLNNGHHHLHGGVTGLGRRVWRMEPGKDRQSVVLRYQSVTGEEGYPGAVEFHITYSLDESGLHCEMHGVPDMPTPVNLAQHNYYNLDLTGGIRQHALRIDAERYLPVDDELIPTGELAHVRGTRFDFRELRSIAEADPTSLGHDHNLCLATDRDANTPAALLVSSDSSVAMSILTSEPGMQLYTAQQLAVPVAGLGGRSYGAFGGICLEAQHWPDSLNRPEFPGIIATPERPYTQSLSILVSTL